MSPTDRRLISRLRFLSRAASAVVMLTGFLVLVGWVLDIATLKSVLPGMVTMKANTALAFVMGGIALWLLHSKRVNPGRRRIAQGASLAVALIGLLTLSEYLFGWDLGIDQALFREPPGAPGTFSPGRMAPNTALSFLFVGLALLLLDLGTRRGRRPAGPPNFWPSRRPRSASWR